MNWFDLTGRQRAGHRVQPRHRTGPRPGTRWRPAPGWWSTAATGPGPRPRQRVCSETTGGETLVEHVRRHRPRRPWTPASAGSSRRWGTPDILVNNAGIQRRTPFAGVHRRGLARPGRHQPDQRLPGRAAGRPGHGRARAAARSSTSARCRASWPGPGIAPYSATKGGIVMLTKGMCADLGAARDPGQRAGAGLLRHRADQGAGRRRGSSPPGSPAGPRPAAGARSTTWSARWSSSPRRRRTSSTARCSTSTAA